MPPEETSPPVPPVPDFTLLRIIGRGSYGDVWLARGATGMLRAVKVVWRERFTDVEPYEREFRGLTDFIRLTQGEARQLALLHVGRNEAAGFFYYVMELADDVVTGREIDPNCYAPLTLKAVRDQSDYVPTEDVIRYAIELSAGLAELHRTGLVHRDIKPSNVIMVAGRPKLADIGLVSVASEAMTFVGTEGFVPPEGPGTRAADVFSLGKVLYELVTGLDRQDFPSLPPDFASRPDRAEMLELNETIIKACAPLASERYPDAESLLHELNLLEAGKSVRRLRFAEKGLARARKWVLVAVAVAIVAGIGATIERNRANVEAAGRAAAEAELADLTRRTLYDASIAAAQRALQVGNYGVARESLERAIPKLDDPDLRGFEWHALYREAQGDPAEIIRPSGDIVTRIEASPDGRWVAVDNNLPTVELYDQKTGEFVRNIPGIHRIAGFTPDGTRIVGSDPNYALETWSLETGERDPVPAKAGINRPLAVDPHAPRLLYFEDGPQNQPHRLAIWNYETGEDEVSWPIDQMEGDRRWLFQEASASVDLSYTNLVTTRDARTDQTQYWRVIDMRTGQKSNPGLAAAHAVPTSISPQGDKILYHTRELHLGPPHLRAENFTPLSLTSGGGTIRFNRSGNRFVVSTYGNRIVQWNTEAHQTEFELRGSGSQIDSLAYSADENFVWSSDRKGEVRRWQIGAPNQKSTQAQFTLHPDAGMFEVTIDTSSSFLITLSSDAKCVVWELDSLTKLWERNDIRAVVQAGPNVTQLVTTQDRLIELKTTTGSGAIEINPFESPEAIDSITASPSGNRWLILSRSGNFVLWDPAKRGVIHRFHKRDLSLEYEEILGMQMSDEGLVISIGIEQKLTLWNALTGSIEKHLPLPSRPARIDMSLDGKFVAVSEGTEAAQILRFPSLELHHTIEDSRRTGNDLSFHPYEPIIATQVVRGSLTLINFETGERKMPLELPAKQEGAIRDSQVAHLTFSPDGNTLVAVDSIGAIRAWHRE